METIDLVDKMKRDVDRMYRTAIFGMLACFVAGALVGQKLAHKSDQMNDPTGTSSVTTNNLTTNKTEVVRTNEAKTVTFTIRPRLGDGRTETQ